ncbi:helix-turn-helix domain-containing protein [Nonomuraea sp. NPDC050643]|uniref:TetR/AcrR family transcriptional regulator n=1 Tax=Nonomuraea sp. NPDC050643 TaxID=3155660 RepID=UPI0033DAF385
MGLREEKKERTRTALVEAAVRLFGEKGYERTTVAEITAAAGMSTRTFFLHFPAKEDVLLANARSRIDKGLAVVGGRRPGQSVAAVLEAALTAMVADVVADDLPSGLAAARARLAASEPDLAARLLHGLVSAHTELAEALARAFPAELDEVSAAAVVGAAVGAVSAAAEAALRQGLPPAEVRAAMLRAPALAAVHLTAAPA